MNQLSTHTQPTVTVDLVDGHPVTYSHAIAKQFIKSHKNLLRDIKELDCSPEFSRLNFEPSSYLDERGKAQPSVTMTRDGFVYLVMGFTGPKAAKFKEAYIARFNELEAASKLLPDESKVKTKDLVQMSRHANELISMQRRCIRLHGRIDRIRSAELRRAGVTPSKPAVKSDAQMELAL